MSIVWQCVAYTICTYCFSAVIVWLVNQVKTIKKTTGKNPWLVLYHSDPALRTSIALWSAALTNGIYAVFKIITGIIHHSIWFLTFGAYYLILLALRLNLIHYTKDHLLGENRIEESKKYQETGWGLLGLNLVFSAMINLVLDHGQLIRYSGFTIYAAAVFAFYSVIWGIMGIFRYRKYNSPVMSAVRIIRLCQAFVSLFSLEVALLQQFSPQQASFNRTMEEITGVLVSAAVTVLSLYMVLHGKKKNKNQTR